MGKVCFNAQMNELPYMLEWVRNQLVAIDFGKVFTYKIELALEEALVNIIQYAYGGKQGLIELSLEMDASCLKIGLRDWGSPFNPLLVESNIDLSAPINERPEGGLGLFFIRKFSDELVYERDGQSNLLLLISRVSQTH